MLKGLNISGSVPKLRDEKQVGAGDGQVLQDACKP